MVERKNDMDWDMNGDTTRAGYEAAITALSAENERLRAWVSDLQSGGYVNCVYCGYRYGPDPETPVAMADVLKEHVEHCPSHPMYALHEQIETLKKESTALRAKIAEQKND